MKPIQFKHKAGILFCSLVLLFSCEIDEEEDLLFQLKDAIRASGTWQTTGLDKFDFEVNGDFTARIDSNTGNGTFRYYETTSESIFNTGNQVAEFHLSWKQGAGSQETILKVRKRSNGDLYFRYDSREFTQIS